MTSAAAARQTPVLVAAAALPACLGDLSIPPKALWLLGDPSLLEGAPDRHVAIVGTRDASPYGERTAAKLAAAAARAGLVVVSGLARGVDAAAHRAALDAGGHTIAVLGTGVDVPYPAGHRTLHERVQLSGLVLSEVEPGTKAFPGCFPRRNRIIAGLCKALVVVEAGFKSGAINSASQALELGRTVAAVPGQMDDPRAAGSNLLIRDGAHVMTSVEDLLGLYELSTNSGGGARSESVQAAGLVGEAGSEAQQLLGSLGASPSSIEDLSFSVGLTIRQVSSLLLKLECAGLVVQDGAGYRRAG